MIYVMNAKLYWNYIDGDEHRRPMKHHELISYLNYSLNLRGQIIELHIKN